MVNLKMLECLKDDDGLTLKNGKPVTYKSGYQVGIEGIETDSISEALKAIERFGGNCGVWFSGGVWFIDNSIRVSTKAAALALGRACKQISILKWSDMSLVYC